MRGPPGFTLRCQLPIEIIPAYAGTTTTRKKSIARARDHPRMCGDHRACMHPRYPGRGSSPHVRGPQEQVDDASRQLGIIPACAGTACAPSMRGPGSTGDHPPHVRGPRLDELVAGHAGGIIPTRVGPRNDRQGGLEERGIIPTRVGTTATRPSRPSATRDHPHTRGDLSARQAAGSSPHAWGPPRLAELGEGVAGIIPTRRWGPLLADGVLVDLVRIIPTRVGTT